MHSIKLSKNIEYYQIIYINIKICIYINGFRCACILDFVCVNQIVLLLQMEAVAFDLFAR